MRIVFAGTPEFAERHLAALLAQPELEVVAVYTQPDRPAGRGKHLQASAVKQLAIQHDIPVEQPLSLKTSDSQQRLSDYQADVMVVVAYGLLLPQAVLDIPKFGCINVHGSLLPRWRGAAPIQRAIWAGDPESGVAIMQMEAGLDTGPVLLEQRCPISPDDTSASLYSKLAELGPQALVNTLLALPERQQQAQAQDDSLSTYAKKLSKEEGQFDWSQSAAQLERNVRAFTPWPSAWFSVAGHIIKVQQAEVVAGDSKAPIGQILRADKHGIVVQTADQALAITRLQPPGKKPMSAADALNGRADWFSPGQSLL